METIKVHYCDFWPEWNEENFIEPILQKHYNVVIDQKNPDVVFHSIFGGMKETQKYKCKKVLFLGENHRPGKFHSDYSISFDPQTVTNFRLPLWQAYILLNPGYKDRLYNRLNYDSFDRFCSFTVSNGGNFLRNGWYQQMNSYKRVHSYGRYLGNSPELQQLSKGKYWRDAKDEFFLNNKHKFAITFENTPYPGYTTEKLMDAFLVGSMPIYWGSPNIHNEFNEKSFINVIKYPNIIKTIKEFDQNREKFSEMYNEPIFTSDQQNNLLENLENFEYWLIDKVKRS